MMAVTLKDIAKKVGKSVTTVSRALHDYDDVSQNTKEFVRKTAAELGYSPSSIAQSLQKQKTDTIGFILPTFGPRFTDPFFSEFLAGLGNSASNNRYYLLVSTCPPGDKEILTYKHLVNTRRVDGFVIVRTRCEDIRIEFLCEKNVPFVAFGRKEGDCAFPFVDEDSEYGMHLIMDHLVSNGRKRIGFIAAPNNLMFAKYRLNGFLKGLRTHNLPVETSLFVTGDLTQRGGFSQANTLLERDKNIDAIVASNDLMAIGAINAVQKRGLIVGKDIAITGFDDTTMAEHTQPPLTTVNQPVYKIGGIVTEMLIQKINGETLEMDQLILKPSLVIRQSSGGQE
jgi:LacI family transcriptional regulator